MQLQHSIYLVSPLDIGSFIQGLSGLTLMAIVMDSPKTYVEPVGLTLLSDPPEAVIEYVKTVSLFQN